MSQSKTDVQTCRGAGPCRLLADRGEGLSPQGIPEGDVVPWQPTKSRPHLHVDVGSIGVHAVVAMCHVIGIPVRRGCGVGKPGELKATVAHINMDWAIGCAICCIVAQAGPLQYWAGALRLHSTNHQFVITHLYCRPL